MDYREFAKGRQRELWGRREGAGGFWTEKRLDMLLMGAILLALVLTWRLV
jgi:hypothetical protein